jgi:uncharacterized protein
VQLTRKTRVLDLLTRYPFLLDYLTEYAPEFRKLRNPVLRATLGRIATLETAASLGKVPLDRLLADLRGAIRAKTGDEPDTKVMAQPPDVERHEQRVATLKGILRGLHAGQDVRELKQRFAALAEEVGPAEIPALEQELVQEGLAPEEIHKLCDLHVDVFRSALDRQAPPAAPPGHPVHTFVAENRELQRTALVLAELSVGLDADTVARRTPQLADALDALAQVELHYLRKENQLFPYLERYGLAAVPQVMWAVHDDVRRLLKVCREALGHGDAARLAQEAPALVRTVTEMVYKEENILFPMTLELLDTAEWAAIRAGEAGIGWALISTPPPWVPVPAQDAGHDGKSLGRLPLDTGLLTLEQLNLMLGRLPVDVTFVDEQDEVRFFSKGEERIFPRSPAIIGRKVQNCHPPRSVDTVQRILDSFRQGTRDAAEFWIQLRGRFVHIRYFAVRDAKGTYRGTVEVSQDVTGIRALAGERRLLDEGDPR